MGVKERALMIWSITDSRGSARTHLNSARKKGGYMLQKSQRQENIVHVAKDPRVANKIQRDNDLETHFEVVGRRSALWCRMCSGAFMDICCASQPKGLHA